ncbi:hypothetical protein [Salinicola rhizosphaerae]|uniref:Uncharacterized protein n=1 Tax=Salinicola rhizosphaerae TaxID=1443141 RepID=A0ABQ3E7D1_9GAMM|nr:hypothetical protein [Salinicola rhizosphaerae]GHB24861.1 hypothetical protein GCM10009038_24940 [Salinicola rhizosphaerae]
MPSTEISLPAAGLRGVAYIAALAGLMQSILLIDAHAATGPNFSELSMTEITQAIVLLLCASSMLYIRQRLRVMPTVTLLLWAFFSASFVRENDLWLDTYVFDGAWQALVTLILIPVLFTVLRCRRAFAREFSQISNTFGFGLFAGGFLTTYVFSRLYGRTELWQTMMGDGYLRVVKDAAEELTELIGYTLLLFACIEMVLLARRLRTPATNGN